MNLYCYDFQKDLIDVSTPFEVDVPVLVLFYNRPELLSVVFEKIREAKPSVLLLYQDGPKSDSDMKKILECRKIVQEIDWQCTVYKMFQNSNYGCDPSGFMSRQWAFSLVEKCIILEDDTVPTTSFFRYCKELLEKYEYDNRIYRICGQNILGTFDPYHSDYFFTKGGSIWGWATWKRVFDEWDATYGFLNDADIISVLKGTYSNKAFPVDRFLRTSKKHKATGKEYFESIYTAARLLGSGLSIIPTKNMISNIGISPDAVHGAKDIRLLTKRGQKAFNAKCFEMHFPIRHPQYILECKEYEYLQGKMMGWNDSILKKIIIHFEELARKLIFS